MTLRTTHDGPSTFTQPPFHIASPIPRPADMTYRDEFLLNVEQFMRKYTLYLPGEGNDGGKIDLDDPTYSQFKASPGAISVPAVPVVAAWREGAKKNHLQLKLHTSRDYKMAHTGRTVPLRTVDSDVIVQAPLMGAYDTVKAQAQQKVFDAGLAGASAKAAVRGLMTASGARLDASERFDCYFLPWFSGRTVEMTLGGNADRFFTATMNGCTFHVAGTAQAPIVRHHNDTMVGDDYDPTVDRTTHQQRYGAILNPALPGEAALSKYPVPNFAGQNATYEASAAETRKSARMNASDLHTLLVGERDPATGDWAFYYQRSAYVMTSVHVTNAYIKDVYVKPASTYQKLRKAVGKEYDATLALKWKRTKVQQGIHNRFTPFARLNFP